MQPVNINTTLEARGVIVKPKNGFWKIFPVFLAQLLIRLANRDLSRWWSVVVCAKTNEKQITLAVRDLSETEQRERLICIHIIKVRLVPSVTKGENGSFLVHNKVVQCIGTIWLHSCMSLSLVCPLPIKTLLSYSVPTCELKELRDVKNYLQQRPRKTYTFSVRMAKGKTSNNIETTHCCWMDFTLTFHMCIISCFWHKVTAIYGETV